MPNGLMDHSSLANNARLKRVNEVLSGYYFNFKTFGSWQFLVYFE